MCRILVADNDAVQLDLHKTVLEIAGHQVDLAISVAGALRYIQRGRAELVIMDLRFPNPSGQQDPGEGMILIRGIREIDCAVPVIVLSGWPDALYGRPEERMVSRILLKPVKTPTLLKTIRELVS
jgi:CheY-like chemotaxis protein